MITDDDIKEGGNNTLGPVYFSSRRLIDKFFNKENAGELKEIIDKISDQIRDNVFEYIEIWAFDDVKSNLKNEIIELIDGTIYALLTGKEWAMKRYPYDEYSKGEEIREAVAKYGGNEILNKRIDDLERKNKRLEDIIKYR